MVRHARFPYLQNPDMATLNQTVRFTFDADTGQVLEATTVLQENLESAADAAKEMDKSIEQSADSADDLSKETKKAAEQTGKLGKGFKKAGDLGSKAMTRVGAATKAAGIGLLLGLLAGVGNAFVQNKERAEQFESIMAQLNIVFTVLADGVASLAGSLIKLFTEPGYAAEVFQRGLEGIKNLFEAGFVKATAGFRKTLKELGITFYETLEKMSFGTADFSEEIAGLEQDIADIDQAVADADETMAGSWFNPENIKHYIMGLQAFQEAQKKITDQMQKLEDAERNLSVETAQSLSQIEALKKVRDDETLSFQERLDAAHAAEKIESALAEKQEGNAKERIRLLREQIDLQGETKENLTNLAEAEIALADAQAASIGIQTELMTSIFGINQEVIAQEAEIAALRRGWTTELLEGLDAEKAAIEDQYQSELLAIELFKLSEEESQKLREEAKMARDKRIEAAEQAHQDELTDIVIDGELARLRAQQDLEDELYALLLDDYARQELAAMQLYDQRIAIAGDDEGLIKKATEGLLDDLAKIEADKNSAIQQARIETVQNTLDALTGLNEAFFGASVQLEQEAREIENQIAQEQYDAELQQYQLNEALLMAQSDSQREAIERDIAQEQEASAQRLYNLEVEQYNKALELDKANKRQFEINKAVSIAQATISQSVAAVDAYRSLVAIPVVGPGLAVSAAAAAIAAGAAQIQAIRKTEYQGTAGLPPIPPSSTASVSDTGQQAGGLGAPQLDLSFLGEGAVSTDPIQAYVIAQDVSNAQQANQLIQDQTTL